MSEAKTVKEVLIAARWILKNVGWCQNSYVKTKDGEPTWNLDDETLKNTACMCAMGAILSVESTEETMQETYNLLAEVSGVSNIVQWNDDKKRTKKQVLALFDKAIKKAK